MKLSSIENVCLITSQRAQWVASAPCRSFPARPSGRPADCRGPPAPAPQTRTGPTRCWAWPAHRAAPGRAQGFLACQCPPAGSVCSATWESRLGARARAGLSRQAAAVLDTDLRPIFSVKQRRNPIITMMTGGGGVRVHRGGRGQRTRALAASAHAAGPRRPPAASCWRPAAASCWRGRKCPSLLDLPARGQHTENIF